MPPRFAYWTIILDGAPTSFRTKEREEILPLFNQLKAKNPGALLKWFSGGRLWDSPDQAREVRDVEKVRRFREERARETNEQRELEERELGAFRERHGRPADGSDQRRPEPSDRSGGVSAPHDGKGRPRDSRPRSEQRGKEWRPGGDHRDPRDKYKLPPGESRKRWKERNLAPRGAKPFGKKPSGDPSDGDRPFDRKPFGDRPRGDRPLGNGPRGAKPFRSTPGGSRPFGRKPFGDRPSGQKRSLGPGRPPRGPRRKG